MRGANNQFLIRMGISPETETKIRELKVYAGQQYVLVYDKNNCVGVVFEHYEKRGSLANGQAEICFLTDTITNMGNGIEYLFTAKDSNTKNWKPF